MGSTHSLSSFVTYYVSKEDYLIVLVDQSDVKDVLKKLQDLAVKEQQLVIAATHADVRAGELFYIRLYSVDLTSLSSKEGRPCLSQSKYVRFSQHKLCQLILVVPYSHRWS